MTCQAQPALGCVYKLVQIDGKPRIKLSDDVSKANIPGRHHAFRLYGPSYPLVDVLCGTDESIPKEGERLLCGKKFVVVVFFTVDDFFHSLLSAFVAQFSVHPFIGHKRAYVTPKRVERLLHLYWCGSKVKASAEEEADAARAPIITPDENEFDAVIGNEDVEQPPSGDESSDAPSDGASSQERKSSAPPPVERDHT